MHERVKYKDAWVLFNTMYLKSIDLSLTINPSYLEISLHPPFKYANKSRPAQS